MQTKTKKPTPRATKATKPGIPAGKSKAPATPAKARKLEQIAESKKGLFAIDPTLLSVEDGFNERLVFGDLQTLAEDIAHNSLEQPLKVRKLKGSEIIYVVHGHRRLKAITEILIPQGRWHHPDGRVKAVDCYPEEQGTTEFDRLAGQLSSNTGLPYNLLEKAGVYKRLLQLDPTLKPADLARRYGESKQAVSDALRLSNDGSAKLHKAILDGHLAASTAITLIKQAGNDHAAQDAALKTAMESANGSGYITPKHLGARDSSRPESTDLWTFPEEAVTDFGWNEHKVATTPDTLSARPAAGLEKLEILIACHKGKWFQARSYEFKPYAGGGGAPSKSGTPYGTMQDAIRAAWDSFCEHTLPDQIRRNAKDPAALVRHCTALGHDLSARFPTGTPWDESILTSLLTAPESTDDGAYIAPMNEEEDEDETDNKQDEDSGFVLYNISDVPETPVDPKNPSTYHETDRFVLSRGDLDQYGLTRLHLLSVSPSENITAYGYRINDHEQLPDTTHVATLEDDIKIAFHSILNSAFAKAPELTGDQKDEIRDMLDDAIFLHLDPEGPAEEPKQLSFVATSQAEEPATGSKNPGFQQTLNSPGGSGGGGGGGGGSTYLDPQTFKAVQKIEDVLEDLADKGKGIPDRVTTADIIVGILRDGRPVSDLKNYLLGK